jgi:cytochrome oxidase Cu insertion factor (SCO1/SenC/PrrC family)
MASLADKSPIRRWTPLIALAAVFLAPLLAGWLFYLVPALTPSGKINHGELIEPPRRLSDLTVTTVENATLTTAELRGKWMLVWVTPGDCGAACRDGVGRIKQVYLALGKDGVRVNRVVVLAEKSEMDTWRRLAGDFPGTHIITGPASGVHDLLLALRGSSASPSTPALYLVDPLGNVIMRYHTDAKLKGILKDLERLLKYSRLG